MRCWTAWRDCKGVWVIVTAVPLAFFNKGCSCQDHREHPAWLEYCIDEWTVYHLLIKWALIHLKFWSCSEPSGTSSSKVRDWWVVIASVSILTILRIKPQSLLLIRELFLQVAISMITCMFRKDITARHSKQWKCKKRRKYFFYGHNIQKRNVFITRNSKVGRCN